MIHQNNENNKNKGSERLSVSLMLRGSQKTRDREKLPLLKRILLFVAWIGHITRRQMWFALAMLGATWGVFYESFHPYTWRRTVRFEFTKMAIELIRGGIISTLLAGTLTGIAAVFQVIYWLGFAGLAKMTGAVLVKVVVREITPVLMGVILLGRNGMFTVTELGMLSMRGDIRSMQAVGLDPFLLLVLPRTYAYTLAGFTLGTLFSFASLITGYIMSRIAGVTTNPIWAFFTDVAKAISVYDYLIIPAKFIGVGFVVGLASCVTGLTASNNDTLRTLVLRGFSRGMMVVMSVSIACSLL